MELNRIVKFRNVWIGVAMLWIVFFHAGCWVLSENLLKFKDMGYGGVDICLFASGIGCYFSLDKNPDALSFLRRRVKRLAPTYFCFIIPWILWYQRSSAMPLQAVLGNLLGIQSLVSWKYHFNWYIGGLVVFYIAMPYLKQITDAQSAFWKDLLVWLLLAAASVPFWGVDHLIVIASRIPVLYSGLVFAKMSGKRCVMKKIHVLLLAATSVLGVSLLLKAKLVCPDFLWPRGLYWYPFALIVPGICVVVSLLAEKMQGLHLLRWIVGFLERVGSYSFELYLVHVFLYEGLMPGIIERFWMIPVNRLWALTVPVIFVGTFLLNRLVSRITRFLNKQKA